MRKLPYKPYSFVFLTAAFCVLLPLTAYTFPCSRTAFDTARTLNREYVLVLFAIPLPFPEIVDLTFSDNGTFTLKSDIFTETAAGTYSKRIFLVNAQGTTDIFYDDDWEELIEITYQFTGYPLGLFDRFMLGVGRRETVFLKDNYIYKEFIFFLGPGF